MLPTLQQFAADDFCYLTTIGRVSGQPHTIEIWFALDGDSLYMLSGSHTSDWVKNVRHAPNVTVRLGDVLFTGQARGHAGRSGRAGAQVGGGEISAA